MGGKGIKVVLNILNNGLRLAEISRNPMGIERSAWTLTGVFHPPVENIDIR